MITPYQSGEALVADIRAAAAWSEEPPRTGENAPTSDVDRAPPSAFHLWWLGQSGFLVQWQGRHLLLDPYLSDSLTRKYAQTDKPHVRMTELIIEPSSLDFVDVVTSSHNHTDHLDAETLIPLRIANPRMEIVVPAANRSFAAARLQVPADCLRTIDVDEPLEVGGFQLNAVPSAHEALDRDEQGRHCFLGYVVRFGPWCLYHSGDTVLYEGLEKRLRAWPIDVALLPINGRAPQRRVAGNLSGREAAGLGAAIGAKLVIPCHYEMFEFNTASPNEFVAECRRIGQNFQVLRAGERWSSEVR